MPYATCDGPSATNVGSIEIWTSMGGASGLDESKTESSKRLVRYMYLAPCVAARTGNDAKKL